jgi:hypothetical protein
VTDTPHRYLTRLRALSQRLRETAARRRVIPRFALVGVNHTGHFFPDAVPELAGADLVSLELPTTPVRAYLDGAAEQVHIRNIFWLDVLEHFRRQPPRCGVFGVNVNPHVRYLRARFYYRTGSLTNDFEAPPAVVPLPMSAPLAREDLGGRGGEAVSEADLVAALPESGRTALERHGIAHVGAAENPFGPARHLVIVHPPPPELLTVHAAVLDRLRPLADRHGMPPEALSRFAVGQVLEALLIPINDFYLIEQLLRHVIRAVESSAPGTTLRVTHLAGFAHLEHLKRLLAPAAEDEIACVEDRRFPLHPAYMVPEFFARHLEASLAALSLRGEAFVVDPTAAEALLDRFFRAGAEDIERRLLLSAIWTPDRPPAAAFSTLAAERPLQPSADYYDQYATRLDTAILEYALAELPVAALSRINERLRRSQRRGPAAAIAQELQDHGLGFTELRRHARLGPFGRRVDHLRAALLDGGNPEPIFRGLTTAA